MAKQVEIFEHTADVGLAARADTLAELLEALAEGLADVVCPRAQVAARERRALAVQEEADDAAGLAVDFLCEVLRLVEVSRFAVASARVLEASPRHLRAELAGEPFDPARHERAAEVKAVTYHQLEVAERDGAWHARVILDL